MADARSVTGLGDYRLFRPFRTFFALESASGIVLLLATAFALVWANSPFAATYHSLWQTTFTAGGGPLVISKPLLLWINDGLMAVFFFVVGLEIKREVLVGELSSPRSAGLAVAAALGGMLAPALIFMLFNLGGPAADGWGIPMATDIAFALGVLALLGPRVPFGLKVFLTAVAIVDDLGAVLVIAIFYTPQVSTTALGIAALVLVMLVAINRMGVRSVVPYAVLGIVLWVAVLKSGVHATIAGVLLAMTIPARRAMNPEAWLEHAREYLGRFAADMRPGATDPTPDQSDAIHSLEVISERVQTPLARLEHELHPWVAFLIVPLFALANAGVTLGADPGVIISRPSLGIILGLVLGKQLGIMSFAWLCVRAGLASLPARVTWTHLYGASVLCGIGFTMSLFIANLAFPGQAALLDTAKLAILTASAISAVSGWLLLRRTAVVGEEP